LLRVVNSPNAIINWGGFSIADTERTEFLQQSSASSVLNRVTGPNPSVISGMLQTNGNLYLVNPNGLATTSGALIELAGGSLGSLGLSNADFLSGNYRFADTPGAGSLNNQGTINVAAGGDLVLAAPQIVNTGVIAAATGGSITLHGDLVNDGVIRADGGTITIFAESLGGSGQFIADNLFVNTLTPTPGQPAIELAVLGVTSLVAIELGGLVPGTDYDPFSAGSLLLQGGGLTLTVTGGFVPQIGDTFQILDIEALAGSFGQITINGPIAANGRWDTSRIYVDGTIAVAAAAAAVPEPHTPALLVAGLGAIFMLGRLRRTRNRS
jgi:filamentous hemagglutinin family protein